MWRAPCGTAWAPRGHRVGWYLGASAQLACASLAGQLAGTCEIVTLDRDSSQPRRTIARARPAVPAERADRGHHPSPACLRGMVRAQAPSACPKAVQDARLGPPCSLDRAPSGTFGLPMGVEAGAPQSPRGLRRSLAGQAGGWSGPRCCHGVRGPDAREAAAASAWQAAGSQDPG